MTPDRRRSPLLGGVIALALLTLAPRAEATWSLVWSDEFDGATLDASNWTPAVGNGCPSLCGWGNNELQYYRSQNISVAGGFLTITAKRENFGGAQFTSGRLHSHGKRSFLYGRIEMRAKLPTGGGMWPAFWMMPEADVYGGWAASGELDIMESVNDADEISGTLHFGGEWPDNTSTGGSYAPGTDFSAGFHTYAVEWEPDQIRWYVDDVLYSTKYSSQWYSLGAPGNPRAPFDQEFYILLNCAVGGNFPGCTSPACIDADFPQEFVIDYVRVYEDIVNQAPTVAIIAPAAGATLPAGDIVIEAVAADADGSVARVEFYDDATLLGSDDTAPYAFTWTGVGDGCYRIVAKAVDDLGAEGTAAVDVTVGAGCGQAAYGGVPPVLPALIEAEDFDVGGEGVAYHDTDASNNGGQYRLDESVDIEICYDVGGGYDVGWLPVGEWLEYTIAVPAAGTYTIETRVACLTGGGLFHLEFDGVDRTGDVIVPVTTGWQTWTTVTATAQLTAGTQVMRFVPTDDGFNVNSFEFTTDGTVDAPAAVDAAAVLHPAYPNPFNPSTTLVYELAAPARATLAVYDVAGRLVRTLAAGEARGPGPHEAVWDGRDASGRSVPSGVYFARLSAAGAERTRRLVLQK